MESGRPVPGKMTDEERSKLAAKLDEDLEAFIEEKKLAQPKTQEEPDNRTVDEIYEELKNHPAFMKDFDPSQELSPSMEGLMKLKYETEDADDKADAYKDDGNNNFKNKKYRWAVDSYTEGIKAKSANKELNAILYCNRAAAQFHIANYGSSLRDAQFSLKFKPDHMKAVIRAAQCSFELCKFPATITWCDYGLKLNPTENKLLDIRMQAEQQLKKQSRDKRKEDAQNRKKMKEEMKLLQAIQIRNIKIAGAARDKVTSLVGSDALKCVEAPGVNNSHVVLDDSGSLLWPLAFLYPEHQESDFIESCHESVTLEEQLFSMFGPGCEPAPWDIDRKYLPNKLQVFFEDRTTSELHEVNQKLSLLEAMQHKSFEINAGAPGFIVLVKDSPFAKEFISRYQ